MAKTKTQYRCQNCNRVTAKYMGKCPGCGEWETLIEEIIGGGNPGRATVNHNALVNSTPMRLPEIGNDPWERMTLPLTEFSRVLGGGIVPGSLILIGGAPGIGKSTLLLQVTALMADTYGPVLYVSGEESTHQIKMRAERLGILSEDLYLVTETNIDSIITHVYNINPVLVVIDSIQTTFSEKVDFSAG